MEDNNFAILVHLHIFDSSSTSEFDVLCVMGAGVEVELCHFISIVQL